MSTEEHIKNITSPGKFEQIGSAFLRLKYPHLSSLLNTGRNEKSETVRSKFDGFGRIEKDKYAIVDYTINDTDLDRKWLSTNDKRPGDLPTAIAECQTIRKDYPLAQFEIFLLTTTRISSDFYQKVIAFRPLPFVDIIIIDNSNIAGFLDLDPFGQYIRKEYLGIEAKLLSKELLLDICKQNSIIYKADSSLNSIKIAPIGSRQKLARGILEKKESFTFLIGDSGSGKSTLLYSLMTERLDQGLLALRIEPKFLAGSASISKALILQLKEDYPSLSITEDLLKEVVEKEMLIIVDDVNREENPIPVLQRLKVLSNLPSALPLKVVVPVWQKHMLSLSDGKKLDQGFRLISLPSATIGDAIKIIDWALAEKPIILSTQQKLSVAKDLGNDPLLLGLFLDTMVLNNKFNPAYTVESISSYIDSNIRSICDRHHLPEIKLAQSLNRLGLQLIRTNAPEPSYGMIIIWFHEDLATMSDIDLIGSDKHIFGFSKKGQIIFRHDRVRDGIIIQGIVSALNNSDLARLDLSDPFYAEHIGTALSRTTFSTGIVQRLLKINPVSVFFAIKFLQQDSQKEVFVLIKNEIEQWNKQIEQNDIPAAIIMDIGRVLTQIDTKSIASILGDLPVTYETSLAKLHSGDAMGGLQFFAIDPAASPQIRNYWRDMVIEHVKQNYENDLTRDLLIYLKANLTDKGRIAAYRFAGFLRSPQLLPYLVSIWENHQSHEEFPDYLWAIARCFEAQHSNVIEKTLLYWSELAEKYPDMTQYNSRGPKQDVEAAIQSILWDLTENQISTLADLGLKNENFADLVGKILGQINSIAAISFMIQYFGRILTRTPTHPRLFLRLERWKTQNGIPILAPSIIEFLKNIWKKEEVDAGQREVAFAFWLANGNRDRILCECGSINKNDHILFRRAQYERMSLGDKNVASWAIDNIKSTKNLSGIEGIWSDHICAEVHALLNDPDLNDKLWFIEQVFDLLGRIPTVSAEQLLVGNWTILSNLSKAVGYALYIATPATRLLAAEQINRYGFQEWEKYKTEYRRNDSATVFYAAGHDPLDQAQRSNLQHLLRLFKDMHWSFGCVEKNRSKLITIERLDSLIPYLDLLNSWNVRCFCQACIENDLIEWMNTYLLSRLNPDDRKKIYPNDDDLLIAIEDIVQKKRVEDIYVMLERNRPIAPARIFSCLEKFCHRAHSYFGLEVLCHFLSEIGSRQNLKLLDLYSVDDETDIRKINLLKANARYQVMRRSAV